nr:MAG TPA: hypothetical protein [Caudoviricetes sp.]
MNNINLIIHIIAAAISTIIYYIILSVVFSIGGIVWVSSLKLSAALICTFVDYLDVKGGD